MELELKDLQSSVVVRVPEGGSVFGRKGGPADIQIPERAVSGQHARISLRGGNWMLEDMGSSNGTFVEGKRITQPVAIAVGTRFALHKYEFQVTGPEARSKQQSFEGDPTIVTPGLDPAQALPLLHEPETTSSTTPSSRPTAKSSMPSSSSGSSPRPTPRGTSQLLPRSTPRPTPRPTPQPRARRSSRRGLSRADASYLSRWGLFNLMVLSCAGTAAGAVLVINPKVPARAQPDADPVSGSPTAQVEEAQEQPAPLPPVREEVAPPTPNEEVTAAPTRSTYEVFLVRKKAVHRAVDRDPTLLLRGDARAKYRDLLVRTQKLNQKHRVKLSRRPTPEQLARAKVTSRVRDAEIYEATVDLVDQLHAAFGL